MKFRKTIDYNQWNKVVLWKYRQNDKCLAKQIKKKGEKTPTTNTRNERRDITRDPTDIKIIIKEEYYEQLYSHKYNSLGEMDQYLKKHKLQKLTQEGRETVDDLTIKLIRFIVWVLPTKEAPGPDHFFGELYQIFKATIKILNNPENGRELAFLTFSIS